MNRIIRTVLASAGAAAVVSGGVLGVAYATSPTPAQTVSQGSSAGADLNRAADELAAQIAQLEKDLAEPMPTFTTPTPTPEAQPAAVEAAPVAPAPAATRAAAKATAAPARAKTTDHDDSDEKSDDKKDSDD